MADQGGFIVLHRKILDWKWYGDSNTKDVFIHCLLKANHDDKTWNGMTIKRGQFFTSYGKMSKELRQTIRQTRTAIAHLISTGELTSEATNAGQLITVENYANYQNKKEKATSDMTSETLNERQANPQKATSETTTNNNINNINNIPPYNPPVEISSYGFSEEVSDAIKAWLEYKSERKDKYTQTGFKSLLKQIEKHVVESGDAEVCDIIQQSMANGWQGICWDKIGARASPKRGDGFMSKLKAMYEQEEQSGQNNQAGNDQDNSLYQGAVFKRVE